MRLFVTTALLLALLLLARTSPREPVVAADEAAAPAGERHSVTIHNRLTTPTVATDARDGLGRPVTVSCSTCHRARPPVVETGRTRHPEDFHQGLTYAHGKLSCLACHHRDDYDRLTLADGTSLAFRDAIQLCGQCHGPQYRDYQHGSHGGMTGYWDLSRGPRERNHCVDCHDAHAPAIAPVHPVFAPHDRFLAPRADKGNEHD